MAIMATNHDNLVRSQFDPGAQNYVTSTVHANGADLLQIAALAAAHAPTEALDLGCGGGHVSYAVAPHAARITACDLSQPMLDAVSGEFAKRGITHGHTVCAAAEALPFADASFDFLACRYSTHHWQDAAAGLEEARRVLRPGAPAIFADVMAPASAAADTHLQAVELLRDTSHVRDYSAAEWQAMLEHAGFTIASLTSARLYMEFSSWTARMRTPDLNAQAIRSLQASTSREVAEHFAIESDGSFTIDTIVIEVR